MTEDQEEPLVYVAGEVVVYYQGYTLSVRPEDHQRLLAAWDAGAAFVDVVDLYGDPLRVKLGRVDSIGLTTPAGARAFRRDKDAKDAMDRRDPWRSDD